MRFVRSPLVLLLVSSCSAFAPITTPITASSSSSMSSLNMADGTPKISKEDIDAMSDEPAMNPDRPELPELKGDFDWDEKFGGDDDWITENVPGKIVINEVELAAQVTALNQLEEKWRKVSAQKEYDGLRILGWTEKAETYNGRFAMFFLTVGLLTEYWTGVTLPGQVEEMLRVGGVIGFEQ